MDAAPDLEQQRDDGEDEVGAAAADEGGGDAGGGEDELPGGVERPEGADVRRALDGAVGEIDEEERGEEAVEPALPGVEVAGPARIVVDAVGVEDDDGEEVQRGVADDEQVDPEAPAAEGAEAELEPLEVHDREQHERRPDEVRRVGARPAGMLDEAGDAVEQAGEREADDHPDHHADVEEFVVDDLRIHGGRPLRVRRARSIFAPVVLPACPGGPPP